MKLVFSQNGQEVKKGANVITQKGEHCEVIDMTEPHNENSTGRVYLKSTVGWQHGFYPSVIDAEWRDENKVWFSRQLQRELMDRSNAMLQDNLCYEDEGAEGNPADQFGGPLGIASICLDHLSQEAIGEYRKAVEQFGEEAAIVEASRHVSTP